MSTKITQKQHNILITSSITLCSGPPLDFFGSTNIDLEVLSAYGNGHYDKNNRVRDTGPGAGALLLSLPLNLANVRD
jgi:hypothetical protein